MNNPKKNILPFIIMAMTVILNIYSQDQESSNSFILEKNNEVPNIILMIGDGMGLSQISAAMYSNKNTTALEEMQYFGLSKTHSYNQLVTDSAASGTAMACGEKTFNGVIGINPKNKQLESILEYCNTKDFSTALIVTSSIVHATPASFYANVNSRRQYEDIALQLRYHNVNYFIGGGKKHFTRRADKRNLIKEMEEEGYGIVNNLDNFNNSNNQKLGFFTYDDEPPPISAGRKPGLESLIESTLNKLKNDKKPFFLMVEGSQIDWGGHANELPYVLSEFKDFNKAISSALKFAKDNGNTLVVVTADHETGGLAIKKGNLKKNSVIGDFTTVGHSGSMVPVFSYGPNSELFNGIYDNTAIFSKLKTAVDN
ncbi:MAG: alkaline phosphatase [Flavobacteriaceae bacterium]|nr:alkaline phosphatase [Flavobacteriaceae bacterium]